MTSNKNIFLFLFFLGISGSAFGQIKEERLVLDKKREPEVRKIEKKKMVLENIKNYPPQTKKTEDSLHLKYTITDIPAASDFKTSTIGAIDISPKFSRHFQNNYFRAGGGNYGKLLADANLNAKISDKNDVGVDLHYISTSGLKKDYPWKSDRQDIDAAVFLNGFEEKGKYNATLDFTGDSFNYYGIYALQPNENQDLRQNIKCFGLKGFYEFYDTPFIEKVAVKTAFLSDHFSTKESSFNLQALLKKDWELPNMSGSKISFEGDFEFKGLNAKFGILDRNQANHSILEFDPKVRFRKGQSYIAVGANMNFISQKNDVLEQHENSSDFSIIPQIEAQYEVRPELIAFASLDGGVSLNSFSDLLKKNPYLVSNQILKPTDEKYKITAGIKGDVGAAIKYQLLGTYSAMDDIVYFEQNNIFENSALSRKSYDFFNTFSAKYADGKMAEIRGSLAYFLIRNLELGGEVAYSKYTLDKDQIMLNYPEFRGKLSAKYSMLNDKLHLGFTGIFASGFKANIFQKSDLAPLTERIANVDGFADINLSAEYQIHKNFSIFALGNNLLNSQYQNFYGYKNLGAQITGGIKFSF